MESVPGEEVSLLGAYGYLFLCVSLFCFRATFFFLKEPAPHPHAAWGRDDVATVLPVRELFCLLLSLFPFLISPFLAMAGYVVGPPLGCCRTVVERHLSCRLIPPFSSKVHDVSRWSLPFGTCVFFFWHNENVSFSLSGMFRTSWVYLTLECHFV